MKKDHFPVIPCNQNALIPKPNTFHRNYRPKFLMNIKSKVFNKMLANPMQKHIERFIHCDQIRLIPGVSGWSKTWKSLNTIYHINRQSITEDKLMSKVIQKPNDHLSRLRKMTWQNITPFYDKKYSVNRKQKDASWTLIELYS